MSGFHHPSVDALLRLALTEDIGTGDITANACIPADLEWTGRLLAKERLVLAGMAYFVRTFELLERSARIDARPGVVRLVDLERRSRPALVAHARGMPDRDAEEPSRELRLSLECSDAAIHVDPRLLQGVLGVRLVASDPQAQLEQRSTVGRHDLLQGVFATIAHT